MKLFEMYYKFKTEIELNEKRNKQIVLGNINQILKELRADNIEINDSRISFYNNSLKWGSNLEYRTHVKKGTFSIIDEDDKTKIIYESYTQYGVYLLIFLALILSGIFIDRFMIIVGIPVLMIGILLSYMTIRDGEKGLINKLKERNDRK